MRRAHFRHGNLNNAYVMSCAKAYETASIRFISNKTGLSRTAVRRALTVGGVLKKQV